MDEGVHEYLQETILAGLVLAEVSSEAASEGEELCPPRHITCTYLIWELWYFVVTRILHMRLVYILFPNIVKYHSSSETPRPTSTTLYNTEVSTVIVDAVTSFVANHKL